MFQLISRLMLLLLLCSPALRAQVISSIPRFPSDTTNITVIYDANQGNGALAATQPPIYAHTGVLTNLSTGPTNWRHVQGVWGTAHAPTQMTPIGNNKYSININPRTFYNVPAAETIQSLAFVFRNTTGSIVGRSADGSDIYLPIYAAGQLHSRIFQPSGSPLVNPNSSLPFFGAASQVCSLSLFVNGTLVQSAFADSLATQVNIGASGNYQVVFRAVSASSQRSDTLNLVALPAATFQPLPAGIRDGINYRNDSTVTLAIYAPLKQHMFVLGDFNDWKLDAAYFMNRTPDSNWFWKTITGLTPGQEYAFQYLVDGNLRIAEPLAEKVLDPWNDPFITNSTYPNLKPYPTGKATGIVSVLQTNKPAYNWTNNNFQRPANKDLVIYELLVRDFIADQRYRSIIDSLDYLQRLGINVLQLMPVSEFEGNNSWGYNPSFYLAPDKAYGTDRDLKALIDSCHGRGIAVVLDMVLNHAFGQCPLVQLWWDAANNRPAANSPYFNPIPKHDFNVGYDFNHDSPATKRLVNRVVRHWMEEYRFDGYRFDLSKGFTQKNTLGNVAGWGNYDTARVALWKAIHDTMQIIEPGSYVILEHFADNVEERELANYGMMFWGNVNHNYNEATMGNIPQSNFQWASHKTRGWSKPHLIAFAESHDEERLMYRNVNFGLSSGNYSTRNLETALKRMEMIPLFLLGIPGPKMIWQFGELGYDFSINRCPNGSINNSCRTDPKPIRWDYFVNPGRRYLYNVYAAMNKLRQTEPAFGTDTFFVSFGAAIKQMRLVHNTMDVAIIGNFGLVTAETPIIFTRSGWWYEYFTGDSVEITNNQRTMSLAAGEYRLYTTKRLAPPDLALSQRELAFKQLGVYPNPTANEVYIDLGLLPFEGKLRITDVQGRLVTEIATTGFENEPVRWDLLSSSGNPVPNGLYLITASNGAYGKVLVQR